LLSSNTAADSRVFTAAVPPFARPVAWLHDALERTNIDEPTLIDAGASADECHAVRILSRDLGAQSDDYEAAYVVLTVVSSRVAASIGSRAG
jgi:hypothetical protein